MLKAEVSSEVVNRQLLNPQQFSKKDGTVAFYHQVSRLITENSIVLDLGAGRASWAHDPNIDPLHPRILKGKVSKLIAVDLDPIVLENPSADECFIMQGNSIPLDDNSVDLVISDFVLEHIESPGVFEQEVSRVLRPGGWFCARTPHSFNYVSLIARTVKNKDHASVLKFAQPDRDEIDVFPTFYRLNTLKIINRVFAAYDQHSYIFRSEPAYTFGKQSIYTLMSLVHKVLPGALSGTIFAFLKKK